MRKRESVKSQQRLVTLKELSEYLGFGTNSARAFGTTIGARREFTNRLVRYDLRVVDAALDKLQVKESVDKRGE